MFKGLTRPCTKSIRVSMVGEQIHANPPQLEQLLNSYCNEGLNMWSNIYRFAERMYDFPILPIPLQPLILPIFHMHTSTIPCMIAISAYMTGYSGVQRYTANIVVYCVYSTINKAPVPTPHPPLLSYSPLLLPIPLFIIILSSRRVLGSKLLLNIRRNEVIFI